MVPGATEDYNNRQSLETSAEPPEGFGFGKHLETRSESGELLVARE